MKQLNDYVMVIDDALDQAIIESLMDEYKNSGDWLTYKKGAGGGKKEPSTSILISHPKIIGKSAVRKQIHDDICRALASAFDQYHKKYSGTEKGFNFLPIKQLVGLRLLKYKKGQSLDTHIDKYTYPESGVEIWPAVTFSLTLNDNFSGGELNLLLGERVIKAKANQIVIFPSNFQYPHSVQPVTRGIRYALVGWFV